MGEGGRGDGGKKLMMRQAQPATKTAVPPIGDSDGRVIRQRRGKPPLGAGLRPLFRCRLGSVPGMQGAKPLA